MTASEHESATSVFTDIPGYTALTEAHGDADAAELAATFSSEISDIARARGGEVIKTISEAVMVRDSDPAGAVALGLLTVGQSPGSRAPIRLSASSRRPSCRPLASIGGHDLQRGEKQRRVEAALLARLGIWRVISRATAFGCDAARPVRCGDHESRVATDQRREDDVGVSDDGDGS
jgi:class 3 adenylate cyclase